MAFDNIVDAQRVLAVLASVLFALGSRSTRQDTYRRFRPWKDDARHPERMGPPSTPRPDPCLGTVANGKNMVRQVTPKPLCPRVAAVNDWCRQNRHWSLRDQHRHLSSMMRATSPIMALAQHSTFALVRQSGRADLAKWLSRRDRRLAPMDSFNEMLRRHRCLRQDHHGYAAASEPLS